MYVIREAKRKFPAIVKGYSSIGGKFFAYVKNESDQEPTDDEPQNRRIPVSNLQKLKLFCT